ncbi:LysR family transcriptional regulator [Actinoplanes sp. NPDC051494]|uniref:LysR family transcriptional regulator n=1 Tax=Actinoplanes sp. NPDC051494 TaxID=3363907 RepID=UPI0037B65DAE
MDSRQLEVFAAVAREGSFTRAAERLHLVQSAVSATIAALESDLGERLFDRTTRHVRPTAAGHALLPHADRIRDAFQAARDAVEAVSGGLSGSIRIGYMTNVTLFDIPDLLGRFSREHPDVTMHLTPAATGTAGLAEGLRRGDLDLAFLSATPADYPALRIDVLASSPLGLTVPAGHPLAGRDHIRLAETAALRFVCYREGFATRTLFDAEFRRHGLHRDVRFETSDTNDFAALVASGLGVGFLPEYLAGPDPRLHWIPVQDADLRMPVSIGTSPAHTLSAAAARLAALARSEAA